MDTEKTFAVRAYTKKELALLYFPDSTPRTAVSHLMGWIKDYSTLWNRLTEMGYKSTNKTFTPRQVQAIVKELGPP